MVDIVLKEAVVKQAEALSNKENGCEYMFKNRKITQLKEMFDVFFRVDSTLSFIIDKMKPFIMEEGRKIIRSKDNLDNPIKFTK